ncbi:hypothetical protein TNCV_477241 [Trichonephila clavipes]|nr:hypothetical protein TNCV_477241 [Trichonephila clavipes]
MVTVPNDVMKSRGCQSGGPWTTSGPRENFTGLQKNVQHHLSRILQTIKTGRRDTDKEHTETHNAWQPAGYLFTAKSREAGAEESALSRDLLFVFNGTSRDLGGLGLPPYTIITHSVKRRQSIEQNGSNHLFALREYRHLKDLRKGPVSRIGLRTMIMKFEETRDLGVLPGRGWKPVGTESIEEVATTVIERACSFIYSSASG